MQNTFVDFRAVKAAVSISMALDHYGVNWLRKRGDELRGRCPIHKGEGTDTFHVNLAKSAFHCFSCKARGNVLDFVAAMEQCTVRDAAVKLAEWFSVSQGWDQSQSPKTKSSRTDKPASRGEESAKNEPLKFQLKGIDPSHSYLRDRAISKDVAEKFGIGYFGGRGSMSGRVVIPIHNEVGELVAYAGRAIDGSEPKYKLPAGFHKSLELYNLHRAITRKADDGRSTVVVVEGFFGAVPVHEAGYPCVALMGSVLSTEQEALLLRNFTAALLLFDGDEAGRAAADDCLVRLSRKMWTKVLQLNDGEQPDRLSLEDLRELLSR